MNIFMSKMTCYYNFFFYGKKKMICCHKFYFVEKVFVFGIILNFMVKNNIATNSP